MTPFLFIRHAETDMAGRFCGHSDPSLNERGRSQLVTAIRELSDFPISRIYTSDLKRALETAKPIADPFQLELQVRRGLREIHFGLWEGLSWSEIQARNPEQARNWMESHPNVAAPEGESYQRFQTRVCDEIEFLTQQASASCIAVVTHAGFIREVLTRFCGVSEQEAWSRTKAYGTVISIDRNVICESLAASIDLPVNH
jgi:alpha-ribazole phosphatase